MIEPVSNRQKLIFHPLIFEYKKTTFCFFVTFYDVMISDNKKSLIFKKKQMSFRTWYNTSKYLDKKNARMGYFAVQNA